ncbi:MAG: glycosyltransferase [Armatimonadetes bacterium CSP1-3]|nr:MAG: glycosyltransferase [Armatimonadetes bacterium CSP1-3]
MTRGGRIAILRSNPVAPDPRVEREARALGRQGFAVRMVAWDRAGTFPLREERPYAVIERIRLPARYGTGLRNLRPLLHWQLRLWTWLLRHRHGYDVIHACDFDTVLPAIFMKWFFGKRVVYDIFDFYADALRHTPRWIRAAIRALDTWIIGRVDAVILADEARRGQVRAFAAKRVVFVYNSPERLSVPEDASRSRRSRFVIAYVGLLQRERGILEVLEVIAHNPDWLLEIAGFGADEEVVQRRALRLPNARFHGRVSYPTALAIYARSDVMFATYDPRVPNHRYASPHKLFEAMMLGKPIIVARGTGIDRLVQHHGLGAVVEYGDARQLEETLKGIAAWSGEERARFATRARSVYDQHFAWEKMEARLAELYAALLNDGMAR